MEQASIFRTGAALHTATLLAPPVWTGRQISQRVSQRHAMSTQSAT